MNAPLSITLYGLLALVIWILCRWTAYAGEVCMSGFLDDCSSAPQSHVGKRYSDYRAPQVRVGSLWKEAPAYSAVAHPFPTNRRLCQL